MSRKRHTQSEGHRRMSECRNAAEVESLMTNGSVNRSESEEQNSESERVENLTGEVIQTDGETTETRTENEVVSNRHSVEKKADTEERKVRRLLLPRIFLSVRFHFHIIFKVRHEFSCYGNFGACVV